MSNQSFHHPNVQLMGMPGMGVGNSPNMQLNMPNNIHPHYMSMMNGNMGVPNLDFTSEETGENIKVCIRIRPMNATEQGRGDGKCVEYINSSSLQLKNKNINKSYSFNIVFGDGASQEDVFYSCSVNVSQSYLLIPNFPEISRKCIERVLRHHFCIWSNWKW